MHTTLVGVSRVAQIQDNIAALDLRLDPEHLAQLDSASQPEFPMLYGLFSDEMRS